MIEALKKVLGVNVGVLVGKDDWQYMFGSQTYCPKSVVLLCGGSPPINSKIPFQIFKITNKSADGKCQR